MVCGWCVGGVWVCGCVGVGGGEGVRVSRGWEEMWGEGGEKGVSVGGRNYSAHA